MRPIAHTPDSELSHSMVHYLLTIHKLKEVKGYARITDIARELGLTKGSVSTAINNLKKKKLVLEEVDSKFLNLSKIGHKEVHQILSSRTLLYYFLKDFVGVDKDTAHKDACLMEHLMGHKTQKKFFEFMKNLSCCDGVKKPGTDEPLFKTDLDLCIYDTPKDFVEKSMEKLKIDYSKKVYH